MSLSEQLSGTVTFFKRQERLMIEFLVVMARGRFLNDFSNLPQSSALKALTPGAALRLLGLKNPPTYLHFLPTSLNSLIEMTYLAFFSSL